MAGILYSLKTASIILVHLPVTAGMGEVQNKRDEKELKYSNKLFISLILRQLHTNVPN
jgi:hypothetical protein